MFTVLTSHYLPLVAGLVCVWVNGFWFFELPALLARKGLYIPMCHVASARRIALKVGLELCGGGGGFQAPGPGVGGGGDGKQKGKRDGRIRRH